MPVLGNPPKTQKGWRRKASHTLNRWFYQLLRCHETPYRIAMGCACGIFSSTLPIFGQTFIGIVSARLLGASVMASLPWSWISNPLTTLPICYGSYRLGLWFMPGDYQPLSHREIQTLLQHLANLDWRQGFSESSAGLIAALEPLWLGSLLLGMVMAVVGFVMIYWTVMQIHRRRTHRRKNAIFKPLGIR